MPSVWRTMASSSPLYRPLTESDQSLHRQTGIDLIKLSARRQTGGDPIDETHIGLRLQPEAQVSVTIAAQMQMLRGLFLLRSSRWSSVSLAL